MMFEDRNFNKRIRQSLTLAWQIFQAKVGNGLIQVDNEASMQLNYAYILQSLLPLLSFEQDENTQLELEKNVKFDDVEEESKELEMRLERLKGDSKPIESG